MLQYSCLFCWCYSTVVCFIGVTVQLFVLLVLQYSCLIYWYYSTVVCFVGVTVQFDLLVLQYSCLFCWCYSTVVCFVGVTVQLFDLLVLWWNCSVGITMESVNLLFTTVVIYSVGAIVELFIVYRCCSKVSVLFIS